jgi:hypothetical protein
MNKRAKSQRILWCLLPSFTRYSLILLLSAVFLSSVAATRSMSVQIAQQPETASTQAISAAAERLDDEGIKLYKQGTAESLRQAIDKWKQVLPLRRQVGDKRGKLPLSTILAATSNKPLGRKYGYLGVKSVASSSLIRNQKKYFFVGYSGDFPSAKYQQYFSAGAGWTASFQAGCSILREEANFLLHDCDTAGGSSGGPIIGWLMANLTLLL